MRKERRFLLLRTFGQIELNVREIRTVLAAVQGIGVVVLLGTEDERVALIHSLQTSETLLPGLDDVIQFMVSGDDAWESTVAGEINKADAIIMHFKPKGHAFPDMPIDCRPITDWHDYYRAKCADPRTGKGLLAEVALCKRFNALKRTVLILDNAHVQPLHEAIRWAWFKQAGSYGGNATVFSISPAGLTPTEPKLGAYDLELINLREVARVVRHRQGDFSSVKGPLRRALQMLEIRSMLRGCNVLFSLLRGLGLQRTGPDRSTTLTLGIPSDPVRLPPDNELKRIRFTPVEKIVCIPMRELVEISKAEVVGSLGICGHELVCPYCGVGVDRMFFYQYGLTPKLGEEVRVKCQECAQRSAVTHTGIITI